MKFDAVSGDYYPIIYFNDYWNLQKDYYPINESLASLPLRVSFCPLSLWRWQLYAAQSTRSPWNFLGDELYEQSDEEQDSVKVRQTVGLPSRLLGCRMGRGSRPGWQPGDLASAPLTGFTTSQAPSLPLSLADTGIPCPRHLVLFVTAFLFPWPGPLGLTCPFLFLSHGPFLPNFEP